MKFYTLKMADAHIPEIKMYSPTEDIMSFEQRVFYKKVEKCLASGQYVDVGDNVGYVFTYLYKVLNRLEKIGPESVYYNLMHLSELYAHLPKLRDYCFMWAGDCLLLERKYEKFLDESEKNLPGKGVFFPGIRLNVKKILKWDIGWELDLMGLFWSHSSTFIKRNLSPYREKLIPVIQNYVYKKGGWDVFFDYLKDGRSPYDHCLFMGYSQKKRRVMPDPILCLSGKHSELVGPFKELAREAENQARIEMGVPAIGEGWISETELFRKIEAHFPQTEVIQHGRPHFLGRQHYDIWMPQWKVAIEFHGRQHFEAVKFFGGQSSFLENIERDNRKKELSRKNGVHLFVVTHDYNLNDLIHKITESRRGLSFGIIM